VHNGSRTCGLPEYGDFLAVPAELVDVLFHPVKCESLVEKANVCTTIRL
jgi:hypothetical protein